MLNRKVFRDLHSSVYDKEVCNVLEELEYDDIGTALTKNKAPSPLPVRFFNSPTKFGSKTGDNTLIIAKITATQLSPSLQLVKRWTIYFTNQTSKVNVLNEFKKKNGLITKEQLEDFWRLKNLLHKLIQLEAQIVLQLCHYRDVYPNISSNDVLQAMRGVLVSVDEPRDTTLFASPHMQRVLESVYTLNKADHLRFSRHLDSYDKKT